MGRRGGWVLLVLLPLAASCGSRSVRDGGAYPDGDADTDSDTDVDTDSDDHCAVPDGDGDGYDSIECGGGDCDDSDPSVHPGAPDPVSWTIEEVTEVFVGTESVAVAVDPLANVKVAFCDVGVRELGESLGTVRVAERSKDGWTVETVDPDLRNLGGISIALGPDGTHVVYGVAEREAVRHATDATGVWVVETVDERLGQQWVRPSIVADGSGNLHVALRDFSRQLYATRPVDTWEVREIDSMPFMFGGSAIALGVDDLPVVAYVAAIDGGQDDGEVRVASWDGATWAIETVVPAERGDGSHDAAIAAAPTGLVQVTYAHGYPSSDLGHASNVGGAWAYATLEPIGSRWGTGADSSIALDLQGGLHVAYRAWVADDVEEVRYGTLVDGDWRSERIRVGHSPSLALGPDGLPRVAFVSDEWLILATRRPDADGVDRDCDGEDG